MPRAPQTSTRREKRNGVRYEIERALAPHVEEAWAEAFVLELRMLDVPGDVLGAALAEVESHCAESGESASDAFGDPVGYARSLDLPAQSTGGWDAVQVLGPVATQVLGIVLLLWGSLTIATGGLAAREGLSAGLLVAPVAVVGAGLLLLWRGARALRFVVDRPIAAAVVVSLSATAIGIGAAQLDGVVVALPALPAAGLGGVLLVVGAGWSLIQVRRGTLADPIVSPVPGEASGRGEQGGEDPHGRRVLRVVTWAIPLGAAFSLGLAWLLERA